MAIVRNLRRICDLTIKPEARVSVGLQLFAAFEVALVISTWPLWWGSSPFPQVPLLPVFVGTMWSKVFTGMLLMSAILISASPRLRVFGTPLTRWAAAVAIVTGVGLVVLNQHRLQAWHWLFLLNLVWMLLPPHHDRLSVMRHTICAVYVCSALSRISANPFSGMTGAIVFKSLEMLGFTDLSPNSRWPIVVCHALTLGELLIGLLLLNKRNRPVGCMGAILLHVSLLMILGPTGLNHHAGVLLWNLCFLGAVPVLFWGKELVEAVPGEMSTAATRAGIAITWLFPFSGLIGLADNWPSWQLYSSRPESWVLMIHCDDRSRLLEPAEEFIGEPSPLSAWCPVKLDRWSLDETGSPLYPEDRFQMALCSSVLAKADGEVRFQIEVSEPGSPFWWRRRRRSITNREELEHERRRFMLNSCVSGR